MPLKLQEKKREQVKLGRGRQVIIPKKIHDTLRLAPGDVFEVELKKNKVILTPKNIIDREIALGLEDIKQGRMYGPFSTAEELIKALHAGLSRKHR